MILVAVAIADLCATPPAPEPADTDDAAAYANVGDDAAAAGDVRVAALAYRKAIALGSDHAKTALAGLCKQNAPDDSHDLLAAIAAFRRGELAAAERALRPIAASGSESAPGAHFFLGMIALQRHAGGTAVREFERASADPAYAELAESMKRLAHRDGTIAAVAIVEPELDTNPQLLPDTPPIGATTGPRMTDEDLLVAGTVTARPAHWLLLRDVVAWRKQRQLSAYDFLGDTLQVAGESHGLSIRYDLDEDVLGGDAYLFAHRGTLAARADLDGLALVASYSLRRRDYQRLAEAPFTGWVHAAEAGVVLHATPRLDIDARLVGWREVTQELAFSDLVGGGQLAVRARVGSRTRLAGTASAWGARYDAPEPDGEIRNDAHVEGGFDIEVDLGDHVIGVCGASGIVNRSSVEDFRYEKLVTRCGIALAIGGP